MYMKQMQIHVMDGNTFTVHGKEATRVYAEEVFEDTPYITLKTEDGEILIPRSKVATIHTVELKEANELQDQYKRMLRGIEYRTKIDVMEFDFFAKGDATYWGEEGCTEDEECKPVSDDPEVAQMVREMKQKKQQLDELLKECGWG